MRQTKFYHSIFGRRAKTAEVDWEDVYEEVLPKVYNYFRYRFFDNSVAEELTSETMTRAWQSRGRYDAEKAAFSTWVLGIARFVAIDEFREHADQAFPLDDIEPISQDAFIEDQMESRQKIEELKTFLEQLSPQEQEIISLKYAGGLTNRAIAGLLEMSESNVGTMLHRCMKKLRTQLGETI